MGWLRGGKGGRVGLLAGRSVDGCKWTDCHCATINQSISQSIAYICVYAARRVSLSPLAGALAGHQHEAVLDVLDLARDGIPREGHLGDARLSLGVCICNKDKDQPTVLDFIRSVHPRPATNNRQPHHVFKYIYTQSPLTSTAVVTAWLAIFTFSGGHWSSLDQPWSHVVGLMELLLLGWFVCVCVFGWR